jgi:hypothetical protein
MMTGPAIRPPALRAATAWHSPSITRAKRSAAEGRGGGGGGADTNKSRTQSRPKVKPERRGV